MIRSITVAVLYFSASTVSFVFQNEAIAIPKPRIRTSCARQPSRLLKAVDTSKEIDLSSLRIGIAGAGAIAFGTASILSKNGHSEISLWSPSGKGTTDLQSNGDDEPKTLVSTGALDHELQPNIVADAEELVQKSDILIVALPANGHKQVFDALAPHLASTTCQTTKHIIVSSHASLGALYLSQLLQRTGSQCQHIITSWGTTVCTARKTSGQSVDIKTIRKSVDTCCVPEDKTANSLELCNKLFPKTDFKTREGLLAISLSNLNPQNHLAISLGNISRMDKGEEWYQFQNITPRIGGFLQGLDRERLEIASVLGLDVKTVYEHLSVSFHVPIPESGCISEMCQEIHKKGNDVHGPNLADTRYVTEDVPFGLALIVALGKLVGKPAHLHESGLLIFDSMYGRDFTAENDLLQAIHMDDLVLEDLKEAAHTGKLRKDSVGMVSSAS